MEIKVKKPITNRVDMAKDSNTVQRSKHINVRYKYVTEFIAKGFCEVIFVKTEDNQSDGFTKNVCGELYQKHTKNFNFLFFLFFLNLLGYEPTNVTVRIILTYWGIEYPCSMFHVRKILAFVNI